MFFFLKCVVHYDTDEAFHLECSLQRVGGAKNDQSVRCVKWPFECQSKYLVQGCVILGKIRALFQILIQ